MTQMRGYKEEIRFILESTYATTPSVSSGDMTHLLHNTLDIKSTQNLINPETITGDRSQKQPAQGNITVSGPVTVPCDVLMFPYWLKLLVGEPVTTGTNPYTHTFKFLDTVSFATLDIGFGSTHWSKFKGCKVNSMSMSCGGDAELVATFEVMGASETVGTSPADAAPTEKTFIRFNNFQATITEGGSSSAIISQLDFTINNNLEQNFTIGQAGVIRSLDEGMIEVSGTLKALFEDQVLYNKAIAGTESAIVLTLTNGANTLTFTFPEIQYERAGIERNGPAGVFVTLPFRAFYENNADASPFKIVAVNTQSDY